MDNFQKLRTALSQIGLDSFLVSSSLNIFYLTGYRGFSEEENEAILLVGKKKNYLITEARYTEEVKKINGVDVKTVSKDKKFQDVLREISAKENLRKTGFEEDTTYSLYGNFKKASLHLYPSGKILEELRETKDKKETALIIEACKIGDKVFNKIEKQIRIGISEETLAKRIEILIKEENGDPSFRPIVAFGKNSAVPHHLNSAVRLKENQIVLLDFGVKYKGYCSDMTRTIFFGKPPKWFVKMYQTVREAQKITAEKVKIGSKASDMDKVARDFILENSYPNIIHSVGHGIGLKVHENPHLSPLSKDKLKEGMIFSIEPGIYIQTKGGIRIEDLYLLTKTGAKKLTLSPNKMIVL